MTSRGFGRVMDSVTGRFQLVNADHIIRLIEIEQSGYGVLELTNGQLITVDLSEEQSYSTGLATLLRICNIDSKAYLRDVCETVGDGDRISNTSTT